MRGDPLRDLEHFSRWKTARQGEMRHTSRLVAKRRWSPGKLGPVGAERAFFRSIPPSDPLTSCPVPSYPHPLRLPPCALRLVSGRSKRCFASTNNTVAPLSPTRGKQDCASNKQDCA